MRQKLKLTAFHIGKLQHENIKAYSEKTGIAVAELIRRAIDEYLERRTQNVSGNQNKSTK